MPSELVGTVQSVIGPVVDFQFPEGDLPEIYDAVMVTMDDGTLQTFEVAQQLSNNVVRSVSMGSTDGLRRGCGPYRRGGQSPCLLGRRPWAGCST